MRKTLILLALLVSFSAFAQWTTPFGAKIEWQKPFAPIDWNFFVCSDDKDEDDEDFQLNLVQYGAYKDGKMLNVYTPKGTDKGECYVYQPDKNYLFHLNTLDGDFMYIANTSADNLQLNMSMKMGKDGAKHDYDGWIKILYLGNARDASGDMHIYLFTVDNLGTYRILEPVEMED